MHINLAVEIRKGKFELYLFEVAGVFRYEIEQYSSDFPGRATNKIEPCCDLISNKAEWSAHSDA